MRSVEKPICERLRRERKARDLSQMDLSIAAGFPKQTVQKLEAGAQRLTLTHFEALCRKMDLDWLKIFDEELQRLGFPGYFS